ncbi:MAG: hypothetical protein WC723_05405 [Candidatus Omnitrophota bacterium]
MDETIKNRIILILAILTAIFFIATVNSCTNASRQKYARDKEMSTRLDLEEKMGKFTQEKTALEAALAEEKAAHQATKKALVQEQLVNQSVKEELHKVTKLKEALEEDLKEALVQSKSAKSRK